MEQKEEPEKVIPANKAKQGRFGTQVLTILLVSLVLAAAAWFLTELFY